MRGMVSESYYRRVGTGEYPVIAVIALHGSFGSAIAWRLVQPYLDGETSGISQR